MCLNAGVADIGVFRKLDDEICQRMLAVNSLHVVFIFKVLLPVLLKKNQRSAVLFTGSIARGLEIPGMTLYSASKQFVSFVAKGFGYELSDRLDVSVYEPGHVVTNMKALLELKTVQDYYNGFSGLTANQAAKLALSALGRQRYTHGTLLHEATFWSMDLAPWPIRPLAQRMLFLQCKEL